MKCKICGYNSEIFDRAIILEKYDICYYRCDQCDFIQTEEPYWLEEAYSSSITKSDIGLIGRNISFSDVTRNLIVTCLDPNKSFLDYGGGYGMFVRLMRDKGFDFYRYDPICENLFAQGFDAQTDKEYSLLTAWEVLEHLVNPLRFQKNANFQPLDFMLNNGFANLSKTTARMVVLRVGTWSTHFFLFSENTFCNCSKI